MMNSIKELAETVASNVTGTSFTAYGLQPVQFLKEIVDAAKKQLYFANFVRVVQAPAGVKDVVIPKRKLYEGRSGISYDESERTLTNEITWTTLDNLDSVTATPTLALSGYAITKTALRTNAINLVESAREELSYGIGDRVDRAIATKLGDATLTTSTVAGAQTLYGGDANADSALSAGDVITTDLVAKAKRYLQQVIAYYWSSGTETKSAGSKNPWLNSTDDPFVLFIGPAQEETFLKDSQFVNAAEYGSDIVIQNGEIGSYLGIRIVVTTNIESVAANATGPDASTAAVDMTRCILCKPKASCALVWGRSPEVKVWDYNEKDQVRISLVAEYVITTIQNDAVVFVDVSDA